VQGNPPPEKTSSKTASYISPDNAARHTSAAALSTPTRPMRGRVHIKTFAAAAATAASSSTPVTSLPAAVKTVKLMPTPS